MSTLVGEPEFLPEADPVSDFSAAEPATAASLPRTGGGFRAVTLWTYGGSARHRAAWSRDPQGRTG